MQIKKSLSLILIDPQVGFCLPSGSLGSYYGAAELREIESVIPEISRAMGESGRGHLVISEYSSGQFTSGDTQHPLSNLCVPYLSQDCQVIAPFSCQSYQSTTVKHEQSAMSSSDFCQQIDRDLEAGIRRFVLAGFLLEHCVRSTALDMAFRFRDSEAEVIIAKDLVASRSEKYRDGSVASVEAHLSSQGIKLKRWSEIPF